MAVHRSAEALSQRSSSGLTAGERPGLLEPILHRSRPLTDELTEATNLDVLASLREELQAVGMVVVPSGDELHVRLSMLENRSRCSGTYATWGCL